MAEHSIETWDLWIPGVGAQGAPFARGRMDATQVALVHAAPDSLDVDVYDDDGRLLARGRGLARTASTPMLQLRVRDDIVDREDLWPSSVDHGSPVILMGGEIGMLQMWWNATDEQEWRWSVEFYNHR